jgi:membrane protease YdiL (CAAX protease family)
MSTRAVAASRPVSWYGWFDPIVALLITGIIVFAGEAFGVAVIEAMRRLLPDANAVFAQVSGPAVIATYQIALLWFITGWWFGAQRPQALGLAGAPVAWWVWPAALVGLYVLKAAVSIAVLFVVHGAGPILPTTSGGVPQPTELSPFGALMRSPAWPLMLLGGIVAAVVEELLYRGYLSRTLEASRLGFWAGATIASVVWAALHVYYPLPMQVVLVAMGLALSWLRVRTGSILPGMVWHIANNTVALVALRFVG